jgi:hypothetical protein
VRTLSTLAQKIRINPIETTKGTATINAKILTTFALALPGQRSPVAM